jgi:uncharacterized membrane protein YphA (DoxX/SURF4 family)
MLSIFPQLFLFSFFAPTILRLTLGLVFIRFGSLAFAGDRHRLIEAYEKWHLKPGVVFASILGVFELLAGVSLVLGYYMQIGALIAGIISLKLLMTKLMGKPFGSEGALFDLVLLAIALSLLLSGAGALAFDMPL